MSKIVIETMGEEDIEDFIRRCDLQAKIAGFETIDAMDDFKVNASSGMIQFGGGFIHFLGHALARADNKNSAKIIVNFREECEEYKNLYKKWLKERSINIQSFVKGD